MGGRGSFSKKSYGYILCYKSPLPFSVIYLALLKFGFLIQIFLTMHLFLDDIFQTFLKQWTFFLAKYFTVNQDVKQTKSRVVLIEQERVESRGCFFHTFCSMVPGAKVPEALLQPLGKL